MPLSNFEVFFDITKSSLVSKFEFFISELFFYIGIYFWYKKNWISHIKKYFSDIKKMNFWCQKMIFWYQKIQCIFWYFLPKIHHFLIAENWSIDIKNLSFFPPKINFYISDNNLHYLISINHFSDIRIK